MTLNLEIDEATHRRFSEAAAREAKSLSEWALDLLARAVPASGSANEPLSSKIDGLAWLEDGWLEGGGVAPARQNLSWLMDEVKREFPVSLEHPAVVPTEEGNVVFEWIRPKARIELEVNFGESKLELYATDVEADTFEEEAFDAGQWAAAFDRVTRILSA